MLSKDSLSTAKAVLGNCIQAKNDAREIVNLLLKQHRNEIITLDNPAHILVDYGDGNWTERAIRAVRMDDDDLIQLSETSMTTSAADSVVWDEDEPHVSVNWPSLLEALIHALSKDGGTQPQKHSFSVNIILRIDCESDREPDGENIADLVGNLDIEAVSRTRDVDIVSTEICGINE